MSVPGKSTNAPNGSDTENSLTLAVQLLSFCALTWVSTSGNGCCKTGADNDDCKIGTGIVLGFSVRGQAMARPMENARIVRRIRNMIVATLTRSLLFMSGHAFTPANAHPMAVSAIWIIWPGFVNHLPESKISLLVANP